MTLPLPQNDQPKEFNISIPVRSLAAEPLLRVRLQDNNDTGITVVIETPKPLFFSGNYYAYDWSYQTAKQFFGNTLEDCMSHAKHWASDLLFFMEEACHEPSGPYIKG